MPAVEADWCHMLTCGSIDVTVVVAEAIMQSSRRKVGTDVDKEDGQETWSNNSSNRLRLAAFQQGGRGSRDLCYGSK